MEPGVLDGKWCPGSEWAEELLVLGGEWWGSRGIADEDHPKEAVVVEKRLAEDPGFVGPLQEKRISVMGGGVIVDYHTFPSLCNETHHSLAKVRADLAHPGAVSVPRAGDERLGLLLPQ